MAKKYTWPKDTAKHSISYAQHQKNVKGKGGGTTASPSGGAGATLTTERVTARARKDPAFLKRALKNPGLRALLPPELLPKGQQAERTLNAPVVPGGTLTGRQLGQQAEAATKVQYGGQESDLAQSLKEQQTRQQQISGPGGWYDQYLAQVQGNAGQVGAINDKAQQQIAALGQMQGDLGAQTLQSVTQGTLAATGAPPPAGTTLPSDIAQTSAQATAARQQMVANLAAQQAGVGANAQNYAQNFAGLVAPQQKIEAGLGQARNVDKVRAKQQDLKELEGAYKTKYRADTTKTEYERVQDALKNELAAKTLGVKIAGDAADAAASTPAAKAATTYATEFARQAAKYGRSPHDWAVLGPKGRQHIIDVQEKKTHPGRAGDVNQLNKYGYTDAEWKTLPAGQKANIRAGLNPDGSKRGADDPTKPDKKNWVTNEQMNAASSQASLLKRYAEFARQGQKFNVPAGQSRATDPGAKLDRPGAVAKLTDYVGANLKSPALLSAALDTVYGINVNGRNVKALSRGTVQKLIAAGYKPSVIASALGVPTIGGVPAGSAPRAPATHPDTSARGGGA